MNFSILSIFWTSSDSLRAFIISWLFLELRILYKNKDPIITNKRGSAQNIYDIPIKNKYKFDEKESNLKNIKYLIYKIFNNHKKEFQNFSKYKKIVLNEKKLFDADLKRVFIKK